MLLNRYNQMTSNTNICYRIILIGNLKVGKTSLLNFVVGKRNEKTTPTLGVQYAPVVFKVGASDIRVNIWDTWAQKYLSLTRSYYRKCHGAIIIFDITNRKSFEDLKMWLHEIKDQIKDKMPKLIIANKQDLVESGQKVRVVSEKEIVDFCVEHNLSYKETSALTGLNVRETFNQFVQNIYDWKEKHSEESLSSDKFPANSVSLQKEKSRQEGEPSSCARCC